MLECTGILLSLLATEEDEIERFRIVIGFFALFLYTQHLNRVRNQANRMLTPICAVLGCLRSNPSGAYCWKGSAIHNAT
jgi:hypothetical protein